jgi:hypothetical protein
MKVYTVVRTVDGEVAWLEVCSSIDSLINELEGVACDYGGEAMNTYLKTVTRDTFKVEDARKALNDEYRIIVRPLK